jgi:hypothetical protein
VEKHDDNAATRSATPTGFSVLDCVSLKNARFIYETEGVMTNSTAFNPHLASGQAVDQDVGKGSIERPADAKNIPWQTRAALPTEYENRLGDALEEIFEEGATELPAVVAALNAKGIRSPDGRTWTASLFEEEMRRLALG